MLEDAVLRENPGGPINSLSAILWYSRRRELGPACTCLGRLEGLLGRLLLVGTGTAIVMDIYPGMIVMGSASVHAM